MHRPVTGDNNSVDTGSLAASHDRAEISRISHAINSN
jgi:hypothetical protein